MSAHFTIVIPTMNRVQTLKWALETCVSQDYHNFTIIVADNNCTDGTKEYLADRNYKNVRVLGSDRRLSMTENWDRIARAVCDEDSYVHYLGDDDGLLPFSLNVANSIIERTGEKVINWTKVEYSWPDLDIQEFRDSIDVPLSRKAFFVDSTEFIQKCYKFMDSYTAGPSIYSSFVHSSILKEIYGNDGTHILRALAPDVYSAFVVAARVPRFLRCRFALSINGGSGYSNGVAYIHRPDSERAIEFKTDNPIHRDLIHAPSRYVAEADSLLYARDIHENWFSGYEFDWRAFVQGLASDLRQIPTGDPKRAAIAALVSKIEKDHKIILDPNEFVYSDATAAPNERAYGLNAARLCLIADMKPLGIENVLGASRFVDAIMPLRSLRWEIEQKFAEPQPPIMEASREVAHTSLLRRAVRRARRCVVGS